MNAPRAACRRFAAGRDRTARASRRCSGRAPLGPGADMAPKRTPRKGGLWSSAGDRFPAAQSEAPAGTDSASAVCESLQGKNVSARSLCSATVNGADCVVTALTPLEKAPSRTKRRARRAACCLFGGRRRPPARASLRCSSTRVNSSTNDPSYQRSIRLASSTRVLAPWGTWGQQKLRARLF